ncbi:unnamed protein product [Nesidiocoris tenuis]|uniref:Uncharacterized protein n=1 Tax=Nesidiocoris tenuis TaxID=355587 RepID=A0A6H5GMD6_9HEMI|nr:unnamed protein product [Nesidiocoris tenuis]
MIDPQPSSFDRVDFDPEARDASSDRLSTTFATFFPRPLRRSRLKSANHLHQAGPSCNASWDSHESYRDPIGRVQLWEIIAPNPGIGCPIGHTHARVAISIDRGSQKSPKFLSRIMDFRPPPAPYVKQLNDDENKKLLHKVTDSLLAVGQIRCQHQPTSLAETFRTASRSIWLMEMTRSARDMPILWRTELDEMLLGSQSTETFIHLRSCREFFREGWKRKVTVCGSPRLRCSHGRGIKLPKKVRRNERSLLPDRRI